MSIICQIKNFTKKEIKIIKIWKTKNNMLSKCQQLEKIKEEV